jgi:hypothetical protein
MLGDVSWQMTARITSRARALRAASREWLTRAQDQLRAIEPLSFADVRPGAGQSRALTAIRHGWRSVERAMADSAMIDRISRAVADVQGVIAPRPVQRVATIVIVAMVTHIGLWLFADPYRFPSYAEIALPGALLIAAIMALLARGALERGWRSWQ